MIKLYYGEECPFCAKVRNKINELKLKQGEDYALIDATQGTPGREELLSIGGKGQVPFIVDGDIKMYESTDIIDYLEKKFAKQ